MSHFAVSEVLRSLRCHIYCGTKPGVMESVGACYRGGGGRYAWEVEGMRLIVGEASIGTSFNVSSGETSERFFFFLALAVATHSSQFWR